MLKTRTEGLDGSEVPPMSTIPDFPAQPYHPALLLVEVMKVLDAAGCRPVVRGDQIFEANDACRALLAALNVTEERTEGGAA